MIGISNSPAKSWAVRLWLSQSLGNYPMIGNASGANKEAGELSGRVAFSRSEP